MWPTVGVWSVSLPGTDVIMVLGPEPALRWRLFEAHFQYLNAFDALPGRADDYDYFRITAGPKSLAARFAQRAPSPARIERAVNRYTGRAA